MGITKSIQLIPISEYFCQHLDSAFWDIFYNNPATILIVGPPDSGKSTLTDYLVAHARREGLAVGWIDADPGQTRLGLPACLWGAIPGRGVVSGAFIGSLSPAGREISFMTSVLKIKTWLEILGVKLIVVDSPGLVFGRQGRLFQWCMAEALLPDQTIVLGEDTELVQMIKTILHNNVSLVPRLPGCRRRSLSERIRRHRQCFFEYFRTAVVAKVSTIGRSCQILDVELESDKLGYDLIGHLVGFIDPDLPVVGEIASVDLPNSELHVRLPDGRVPEGSIVIGTLRRSTSGEFNHVPNLADPNNIKAHF